MSGPTRTELRLLFGPQVLVDVEPCIHGLDALWPAEAGFVAHAVRKRQREFASARVCARRLLSQMAIQPTAIVPDADRCPQWPGGVVGSITHTRHFSVVALAPANACTGLGVDIEPRTSIEVELSRIICLEPERDWLEQHPPDQRGLWVRRFFCAKEAFYKAQFPLTRRKLGFKDVHVRFADPDSSSPHRFTIAVIGDAADGSAPARPADRAGASRFPLEARGRVVDGHDHLLAGVACPSVQPDADSEAWAAQPGAREPSRP
ncbi:MAG: 4'-phosphopantetheinyl transferase superfamily protein [Myxococcales bacterium FL481]|nr:MAG: 4'-phosphopantetheinyl transferase superfamily protein [Myxococcales bacterium FL481]